MQNISEKNTTTLHYELQELFVLDRLTFIKAEAIRQASTVPGDKSAAV